jgi:hypothetical protein
MHDSAPISADFRFLGRDMDAIRRRVRPTQLTWESVLRLLRTTTTTIDDEEDVRR